MCTDCRFVRYCGTRCQISDWPTLWPLCRVIVADIAAERDPKWNGYTKREKCDACAVALIERSNLCKGCLSAAYCSETCARGNWPEHMAVCESVRAARLNVRML